MTVWAIADLHLSFGVPDKKMDVFGEGWANHTERLRQQWCDLIKAEDLVLVAGDISWAMRLSDAKPDLEWLDQLPGTKVLIKGNHDYWWGSLSQMAKILPSTLHLIQNNAFHWGDISIAGARLWDTPEYQFGPYIQYQKNTRAKPLTETASDPAEAEKIFERELGRLDLSLRCLAKEARPIRMVMTHYPPIGADLHDSRASRLLEKYEISTCVFGHLHNVKQDIPLFGEKNGIRYLLTSCDYLRCTPLKLM
jgi:predicted phosphohydrolase